MKIITDYGIYLNNLTNVEADKIIQKFDNLVDFCDEDKFGEYLYMEHLTLEQFKEVKKWLKKTFNVKI